MKISLRIATAFLIAVASAFAERSEKEIIDLINQVITRVNHGEIKALNDLTTLPGDYSTPAFLVIFKQNYNLYGATAQNRAIGAKAAELITTTPGGEKYLVNLLNNAKEGESNGIYFQEVSAINCLQLVNNKLSVRVLCGALFETEIGRKAAAALASMNLPDAPYPPPPKNKPAPKNPESVAKWKLWWDGHKANYTD